MIVRLAGDVDRIRIIEHLRVAVGGANQMGNRLAFTDLFATQLEVLQRHAGATRHRRVVPQELLDGAVDQAIGIGLEFLELFGVLQKRQHAAGQ